MKKGILIASTLLLLATLMPLMVIEVYAGCDDSNSDCTHYGGNEWEPYDIGIAVGVHAWSAIYGSYYENEDWMFRRLVGEQAYANNSQAGSNFRCYRVMYGAFSETQYVTGEWSLENVSYQSNWQWYYLLDWGTLEYPIHDEEFTQICYMEGTAWFRYPHDYSTVDLWYCFTSTSVDRL